MGWSRQLGTVTSDEASGVAKRSCEGEAKLSDKDAECMRRALVMAKAGIEQLGGTADVWIGANDRIDSDGSRLVTISATVSVYLPPATPVPAPTKG